MNKKDTEKLKRSYKKGDNNMNLTIVQKYVQPSTKDQLKELRKRAAMRKNISNKNIHDEDIVAVYNKNFSDLENEIYSVIK